MLTVGIQDGEKNLNAKLTWEDVRYIRKHKWDYTPVELADKFNVTRQNIDMIINNRSWKEDED